MIPLVTTEEMRRLESAADAAGLTFAAMMESAGAAVASEISRRYQIMDNAHFQTTITHATEMGKFDLAETSTLDAVKKLSLTQPAPPLVLVHGLLDLQVPTEQTQTIFNAYTGPKKMIVVIPGPEQAGPRALRLVGEEALGVPLPGPGDNGVGHSMVAH